MKHGQIYDIYYKKSYASNTYEDKKTLEFIVTLAVNTHKNYSSMCAVLPIQIMKKSDNTQLLIMH